LKTLLKLGLVALLLPALTSHAALTVTNIAPGCSAYHSLFLKSDGSLWAMGTNGGGQLGDGTFNNANRPEQIVASGVTTIAAGATHSLFLKSDGSLWAMGNNQNGQLGDGTYNKTNRPEQIIAAGVTAIAAGGAHSLFLKSDGSLWAMGNNQNGQLGDGTTDSGLYYTNRPEQVVAGGVTAIAAGYAHSLFLKSDGSLWAMGVNYYGTLGDGTFSTNPPYGTNRPEQIVTSGVTAIAAGNNHNLFLKSDGSLWAMGYNNYGQLGDGTLNATNRPEQIVDSGVMAIAAGINHSLFLKMDGSLWAMGGNNYGQLGDGTTNNANQPKQIVAGDVIAIAAGAYHSMFLKSDGSLWAMGWNSFGQLGDGFTNLNLAIPEQICPSPQPVLSGAVSSQNDMQLNATCGFGGKFYLLGSADLTLPLNQWTPLATNAVTARGTNNYSVTLTNAVNSGSQQFYILQSP
jgi:alpha-tubulin suppressor-like RCC1 family protein